MCRHVSKFFVSISLVSLLFVIISYVWSYFGAPGIGVQLGNTAYRAEIDNGCIRLMHFRLWGASQDVEIIWGRHELKTDAAAQLIPPRPKTPTRTLSNGWGFGSDTVELSSASAGVSTQALFVPHWFPALLLFTPVAVWTIRRRQQIQRVRRQLCVACGYDLRATPSRCPECGAIPAASA
jgi:hypothetical protein